MKALVYTEPRRVAIQELPDPQPKANEVLVRVRAAGVCGSDLDGFLGRSKKRRPPLVLGHEFSGEIVETGKSVSGFRPGERAAIYPLVVCEQCRHCRARQPQRCPQRRLFGLDCHGGLAEYVAAPEECVFRISAGMSYSEGALVEPLANALHVVQKCGEVKGRTGLVYGAGSIGFLVQWMARHRGAQRLAVVDVNPCRLSRLKELGTDLVVNAREQDPVDMVRQWTSGQGVDFAVDAVGHPECRRNTVACTAPGGTVVWIGLAEDLAEIDGRALVTRELELKGSYAYTREDFAQALALLEQKALPVSSFASEVPLEEGQRVFEELASGRSPLLKVIFKI